jgi:hypothetical protein
VQNNPETSRHFERCVQRETDADRRSGWRERESSEINRVCVGEARDKAGQPLPGRSREEAELDRLWLGYHRCDDWPAGSRLDVQLCETESLTAIDAAKARHELRSQATLDREQRERHHTDVMGVMDAAPPVSPGQVPAAAPPPAPSESAASDRQQRADAIAKSAPPWWCFEGSVGTSPTGWCAQASDACTSELTGFTKTQHATVTRGCEPQPLAACVGATQVLRSARQVDCFTSFAGCEAFRAHLRSGADFSGVTTCESTPTSWVAPKAASPF